MRRDVETVKFIIYNFKDRKEKRNEWIESPILRAHGYEWRIDIYPRGCTQSSTDQESVSCYLVPTSIKKKSVVTAGLVIRCKQHKPRCNEYNLVKRRGQGWKDFLKRNHLIAYYLEEDGSLVIECDIHIAAEDKRVWYPKELQRQDLLVEVYQNPSFETVDVVFSVGDTLFRAHTVILYLRAKNLYEIAKDCDSDVPIRIHSVSKEIFKIVLEFVYTVKNPEIENTDIATELLVAADRYDCVHLKLFVESVIVDKFLAAENAADLLIFADSHSCGLLKEAATNLFVTDATIMKSTESWSKLEESARLLKELLVASSNKLLGEDPSTSEIDLLDVAALRQELGEANLELDGSREVLIDRLSTHRQGQDTEK